jgi:general secretion pathway protein N
VISALRPLGGVLAAIALWAFCLLLLAVAGLGGFVDPHPPEASLAPPLPQVSLIETAPRLQALNDYPDVASRPLLSPDRRPAPVAAAAPGTDEAPLEATLTSVLIAGDVRLAIVEKKDDPSAWRVREGELLDGTGWRLVELQPRLAVFEGPQGRRELVLRVFDGSGGEMPPPPATAMTNPPADAGQPADGNAVAVAAPSNPPAGEQAAEMTPEQQVEAIRRRIEARRAMRAQEGSQQERAAPEQGQQVE